MKQDVNISIRGTYIAEDQRSTTELFTAGSLCKKNGHYYITYQETETTGFEGCTTTMKVEDNRVTVTRRGPNSSHLVLQKGIRNIGRYDMMGSQMEIGIFTNGLDNSLTEDGGTLRLRYTMDMNYTLLSENELNISVTKTSTR